MSDLNMQAIVLSAAQTMRDAANYIAPDDDADAVERKLARRLMGESLTLQAAANALPPTVPPSKPLAWMMRVRAGRTAVTTDTKEAEEWRRSDGEPVTPLYTTPTVSPSREALEAEYQRGAANQRLLDRYRNVPAPSREAVEEAVKWLRGCKRDAYIDIGFHDIDEWKHIDTLLAALSRTAEGE